MSIKVAVVGAAGRMGVGLSEAFRISDATTLVARVEHAEHPGLATGSPPLTAELDLVECDVVIDFSSPARSVSVAAACRLAGVALVCGTTGLDADERAAIASAADEVPVIIAANTSLGVNVLSAIVETAVRALSGWDAEIVELHHKHKKDSPSGTAIALAEAVAAGRDALVGDLLRTSRAGQAPRVDGEIGVFGVRGGDVAGEHTVYLFGEQERIELTHRATDRQIFINGAVRAAIWLAGRSPGLYTMRDVLFGLDPARSATDGGET